jgi:hypothetical protein
MFLPVTRAPAALPLFLTILIMPDIQGRADAVALGDNQRPF